MFINFIPNIVFSFQLEHMIHERSEFEGNLHALPDTRVHGSMQTPALILIHVI